jgi:Zn finger protein HypA/HybF involved in hydrogenase expression
MNKMFDEPQLQNILSLPCKSCGSKIGYSAEKHKLSCEHCGYTEELVLASDKVVEQSLHEAMLRVSAWQPATTGKRSMNCKSCGAKTIVEENDPIVNCTFCSSKNVNVEAFDKNLIQPIGIIPFLIAHKTAESKFREWIGQGWFHPSALSKAAELGEINGVYTPFWTYDAHTNTDFQGEAGFYYYVTVSYTDSEGRSQTRQEQRTRWEWRSGSFSHFFDDVLVVASKGIPQERMDAIAPFNLTSVINFDPRLLLNWRAEVYGVEVNDGYQLASRIMDNQLYNMSAARIGGDTYRNLSIDVQKSQQTFKHILLPVWLCAYSFNNKVYQFAINGQTGKVSGEKPYSWIKITFAVLLGLAVLGAIFYWYQMTQQNGR